MEHAARCRGHRLLSCGTLAAQDFASGDFNGRLLAELSKREEERKNKGIKGFQRTPAFVHAVVLDVLGAAEEDEEGQQQQQQQQQPAAGGSGGVRRLARGGFTDVGMHTGGQARNTAWPLVRQTIQVGGATR